MVPPLRIAYILTFDPSVSSGLWLRLQERIEVWSQMGVNTDVLVACKSDSDLIKHKSGCNDRLTLLVGSSSFLASFGMPRKLREIAPDVVYMRYNLPYPAMIKIAGRFPTVLEIHSDDRVEWQVRRLRYRIVGRWLRNPLLKRAAGFVFVDPDLADSLSFPSPTPRVVIPNGIRVSAHAYPNPLRDRRAGAPRLVLLVGNSDSWQGLEKFYALAELLPAYEFHVVGVGAPRGRVIATNLHFHGRCSDRQVSVIVGDSDFGVGNLALELINRPHPSPLKVREYVAYGLPCILAHSDPDLAGLPGVLNLGYGFSASPRVAAEIEGFVSEWVGRWCPHAMVDAVDLNPKEGVRLEFMGEIVRQFGQRGGMRG